MKQDIKKLYGRKLGATDGDIGEVKDFYFDGQSWAIRYLVADTGSWLSGRQVLLPPHSLGAPALGGTIEDQEALPVKLTRHQIETSPAMDTARPVSRQYEADYYRHYGWPIYWQGGGLGGAGATVALPLAPANKAKHRGDAHLRSTKAVTGYQLQARDGSLGTVHSFIIDDQSWAINELVITSGLWPVAKKFRLLPANISRISYEDSTVFTDFSADDLMLTTEPGMVEQASD